jgi:solute carrier family 13 (sodium-dependent dicarboxylate transporter), member 2/3/5
MTAPPPARRRYGLVAGALLFAGLLLLQPPAGLDPPAWRTAAVAVLMATWWMTEAAPIAITALLPLVLFPILDIAGIDATAAPYANPVIFLFLGGFMIAQAMQRWGLHRRIALNVIRATGTEPRRLIAGFMLAAAFLSMWVSNTAVAVIMLPIGLSVIELARRPGAPGSTTPAGGRFGVALMLGIAYATSIGGVATLIGTPPNALLAGFMAETYGTTITFARWLTIGLPLSAVMLPVTWLVLTRLVYPPDIAELPGGDALIAGELDRLGPRSAGETAVAFVFVGAATAWIARPLLVRGLPGISDAGIAIAAAIALFLLPTNLRRGEFALDWESARRLPWDVLILFGGGLSLAAAISGTGLAAWIGHALSALGALPIFLVLLIVTSLVVFLTELTSNTASAATFLPILAALALAIGVEPLLLAAPVALAASCAFMLPVATPPNAIVYGSGYVTIPQMARAGIALNILFSLAIPLLVILVLA